MIFVGYLEQGLLVTDGNKLGLKYIKSTQFKIDILSVFPFDILSIKFPFYQPICRFNRLLKISRLFEFLLKSETFFNYPYLFRMSFLILLTLLLIHWNGCFYFLLSGWLGIGSTSFLFSYYNNTVSLYYAYADCFYWSTLVLTTIAEVNNPTNNLECVVLIIELLIAIVLFASIIGNIGEVIENINISSDEFQDKVDSVKGFFELRKIDFSLQDRIFKLFDYKWQNKQNDDDDVLEYFSDKLISDVACNVSLEILKKVNIFSECEASFLEELVTKLKLRVYSPEEYVCRKGDIGKEMYIIKKGKLTVVSQDGKIVFVTLLKGAYFGELSILNIQGNKNGNRRTANVKSVGYSDLYCLTKKDLWDAIKDYPLTKKALLEKGKALLRKNTLLNEDVVDEEALVVQKNESIENFEYLNTKQKYEVLESVFDNLDKQLNLFLKKLDDNMEYLKTQLTDYENLVSNEK